MTKAKLVTRTALRHGLFVAPTASTKVTTLVDELATIREELTTLNERKTEIGARLLKRVATEGEADADGKVRLQTADTNLVIVATANRSVDVKKLLALGVKATIIEQATNITEYAYVSVTKKKEGE